jgi:hypothetical protein
MDLVVAPLEYHEQMKLAETMAYTGMSQSWWRRTLTIGAVRSIDGSKVPRPSDPAHVRDTLRRLGKDGYAQVEVLVKAFRAPGEAPDVTTETLSTLERWELEFMCGDFYDIPAWERPGVSGLYGAQLWRRHAGISRKPQRIARAREAAGVPWDRRRRAGGAASRGRAG